MKVNKDKVYIFNQPKHIFISLVIVKNNIPLTTEIHNAIEKIREISDVIFIFSDFHFPKTKNINKIKFSNLYRGIGFIDLSDDNIGNGIFKILEYSDQIFNKHLGSIIFDTDSNINSENIENIKEKILQIGSSSIIKPILKIERLSTENFYELYKEDEKEKEEKINKQKFFRFPMFINKCKNSDTVFENLKGAYCSYTTDSDIIFLKSSLTSILLSKYQSDEIKNIINSFSYNDNFRYMIASLLKILDIDNVDCNILDLDINKLINN